MDEIRPTKTSPALVNTLLCALGDLLDQERESLLAGDLDAISHSLHEKERLIEVLNAKGMERSLELSRLSEKLARNQALLDGALEGIRTVAERISTLRRIRSTLETYDKSGRKMTIEATRATQVEKRA
ncbi:MAG: hypothetical protein ACU0B7_15180 [Paracoccaceae bacterium]|uniref:hypothetical protein n=1 Tax=Seohaeicola saemankumensis TaxID=481181 RepID=UPI001E4C4948|nr:hypothetical protein [Seohaeicola saemankumensis]MCD1625052.1 hypothetical protein [Seohaeicola saemankumensis]